MYFPGTEQKEVENGLAVSTQHFARLRVVHVQQYLTSHMLVARGIVSYITSGQRDGRDFDRLSETWSNEFIRWPSSGLVKLGEAGTLGKIRWRRISN